VPQSPPEQAAHEAGRGRSLLARLWDELVEILGPAATAALLRRSIKRAAEGGADLQGLAVARFRLAYALSEPRWTSKETELVALRAVARELGPLLVELTGHVVIKRLSLVPELRDSGISFMEDAP
jgi:hypothetical protein